MNNENRFRDQRPYDDDLQWNQGYGDQQYRTQGGNQQRVNYIPDNNDNRNYGPGNPGNRWQQQHGNQGYGRYGAYSSDHGYQQDPVPDRYGNTSYGKQYYEERDRMRNQGQQGYRGHMGEQHHNRSYLGHNYGSGGTSFQNQGYGSSADGYRSDLNHMGNSYLSGSVHYGYSQEDQDHDRGWWDRTRDKVASWLGDDDAARRHQMDQGYEGNHRGKGPRNYQRSQDRIREDVCERLSDDDRIDASDVQVQVDGHDVVLTGTVHSKAEKRRAEDLVESISGVKHVENRLKVHATASQNDSWGNSLGI